MAEELGCELDFVSFVFIVIKTSLSSLADGKLFPLIRKLPVIMEYLSL